jgi:hypothetical protein
MNRGDTHTRIGKAGYDLGIDPFDLAYNLRHGLLRTVHNGGFSTPFMLRRVGGIDQCNRIDRL